MKMNSNGHIQLVAVIVIHLAVTANLSQAGLVIHFDPNDISTLFQDGNVGGGTIPVTGLGDPVRWITDVRSSTPGGGTLDGFVDVQQAVTGATLVDSPGGSVLSFAGGNLLGFDADVGGTIDGTLGAMDTDIATLILVGQANSAGSGIGTFLDMRHAPTTNGGFGLQYDYGTGELQGLVAGSPVAGTPLATDQLFVATLAWDGPNSSASLTVDILGDTATNTTAASNTAIDHDRYRLGTSVSITNPLNGLVGDVLIYNDVDDHSAVHQQLVRDYAIPEPATASLLALAALAMLFRGRRFMDL